jgi:hypothetical protein
VHLIDIITSHSKKMAPSARLHIFPATLCSLLVIEKAPEILAFELVANLVRVRDGVRTTEDSGLWQWMPENR